MSHEIRTPLNAILGLSELLKGESMNEDGNKYIELMRQSSKALLSLINDVLSIDRIESGKEKLKEDIFSPLEVMQNTIDFYQPKIQSKGIEFKYIAHKNESIIIKGDRTKFEQILINLISNAIKFTQAGRIDINYKQAVGDDKLSIQFKIKDSGIGIPNHKLSSIFERFNQLDSGMRKKHSGGGLGLYITKLNIELMQGNIMVKSILHKGSTFDVHLDFPLAAQEAAVKESQQDTNKDLAKLNVLAVDDNKLNNIILSKVLKIMKMDTDLAYNGTEALQRAQIKNFDLIFMDVHMPEMDGFETTRRIRETNKNVLIIGLSADATQSAIEEGYRAGMDHYFTKPLDRSKLKMVLDMHFSIA